MKYLMIFTLCILMNIVFLSSYAQSGEFGFVNLNDSYLLGEEFSIVFQKITHQPCPSYEISLMKEGIPESEIHYGAEPLCAISGSVEPHLFSGTFEKPEFFDSIGTYSIKITLDNETINKKIQITNPESSYIPSPLKQWQLGIRWSDAECRGDLELVIKISNGRPSCVKSDSVEPLVWRWWATTNRTSDMIDPQSYDIVKQGNQFQIKYLLIGATLSEITHDADSNSIHVKLNESQGGKLVISLPRELIDAQMGSRVDDVFFVLIDGVEFAYGEKTSQNERTLTIHFPINANDVEIIGTNWI